jgi:excisionase family DNA binding protein
VSRRRKDGTVHRVNGALLDVKSAADYLGVTASAMRHMLERGAVPGLRLKGRVYLRRATLDRHLERLERDWMRARGETA